LTSDTGQQELGLTLLLRAGCDGDGGNPALAVGQSNLETLRDGRDWRERLLDQLDGGRGDAFPLTVADSKSHPSRFPRVTLHPSTRQRPSRARTPRVNGPSRPVRDIAAAASRAAGAGGRTMAWPLEQAREKLGAYADALVLDQQASGRRAKELLGWKPHRPDLLEDVERGSYAGQ